MGIPLPAGMRIRVWTETDFAAIEELSAAEGWPTPATWPHEALTAWQASWQALVLLERQEVIGFLRAPSDGQVTTHIADVLVPPHWRGLGLGRALVEACQRLVPATRLDLLSTASADGFYETVGFRRQAGFRRSHR